MINKLSLLLLTSASLCIGQSVLTTPAPEVQSAAQRTADPGAAGSTATSPQDLDRRTPTGGNGALDLRSEAGGRGRTGSAARFAGPLKTKSDFKKYVEDATGRHLPVYGRQLFDQVPSTFAPVENIPVPATYVVGPGDQLLIRAWGKIELNSRVTVDRNGQINLPRVGTLSVAGLQYAQLQGYVKSAVGALFKDFELSVTLGELRSIQIFVLGQARQPGAYTVSSLSTLVDALFASGGPSATGTMRRIELRRDGQPAVEFDLYDLVARGDKSHDVRLLPGDVVFIPSIGPQIAISGGVNQPGIYELKSETSVAAAVRDAGGLTSLADAERAVLERIEDHRNREVQEFALDAAGQARQLKDGDLLRVFPLSSKIVNAVTLRGNVAQPGLYAWKDGMRISDLIPSRSALVTRGYWNRQNHLVRPESRNPFAPAPPTNETPRPRATDARTFNDREDLSPDDEAMLPADPRDAAGSARAGFSQTPRTDEPNGPDEGIVNTIGQNSAEINWEYALIERLDEHDLSTLLIPFRLAAAIESPASADNQLLKPGDVVSIFSRADIELPMDKHSTFVRIGGEVNAPGIYRMNSGETLRDVVQKAGGLTQHSYLYASVFTRVSTRKIQEAQLRQSAEQMQRELVTKYAGATPQPGQTTTGQQAQLALQQEALARLTSITPTGRVVLNMKADAAAVADVPDLPLEDGDVFYVPPRLSTVQVTGAVYNANAFRYQQGERLIRYLNAAGGATREADQKRIYVIRADGTVVSRQSRNLHVHGGYENLRLLPGDAIVVPEKMKLSSKMTDFLQATQFMSQLGLTAAAISVIK